MAKILKSIIHTQVVIVTQQIPICKTVIKIIYQKQPQVIITERKSTTLSKYTQKTHIQR